MRPQRACATINYRRFIMLTVNARRGESAIHGHGLIAQEFIPKGALIWVFQPGFDQEIDEGAFAQLPANARDYLRVYAYYNVNRRVWIFSGDDDRFTNHSDAPNSLDDDTRVYAARDIQAGEEITADYNDLGETHFLGYNPDRMI